MSRIIIFTDLDGTLLDHDTYSFDKAREALAAINSMEIPLILCSSKTRAEIELYRRKIGNNHPFLSENGGGIFIPSGYFEKESAEWADLGDYTLIRLGARYSDLRAAIEKLRADGFAVKGFGDMTAAEISRATGLSLDEAELSKLRDFDEAFLFDGGDTKALREAVSGLGFYHTMGRYHHILGSSDKGKAVLTLSGLYRDKFGEVTTVGIGDSPNDVPMLSVVDIPVVVQQPDGKAHPEVMAQNLRHADGVGPDGWNKAVLELIGNRKDMR